MVEGEDRYPVRGLAGAGRWTMAISEHRGGEELLEFLDVPLLATGLLWLVGLLEDDLGERVRVQVIVAISEPEHSSDRSEPLLPGRVRQIGHRDDMIFPLLGVVLGVLSHWVGTADLQE